MKRNTRNLYLIRLIGFLAVVLAALSLVFMQLWIYLVGLGMFIAYFVLMTRWDNGTTDNGSERSRAPSAGEEKI